MRTWRTILFLVGLCGCKSHTALQRPADSDLRDVVPAATRSHDGPFVDLGPQVFNLSVNSGVVADYGGDPYLYTVIQGEPARLAVIHLATLKVVKLLPLPGAIVSWALSVGGDGRIYLGTTSQGLLFSYAPLADTVKPLGVAIKGETAIWDLAWATTTSTLYGATSGSNKVFSLVGDKLTDLGSMVAGADMARSLAYDSGRELLYVGVGTPAHLVELDPKTGRKENILPAEFKDDAFVYDLDFVNGLLFAKLEPSYRLVVLDPKTRRLVTTFKASSRGVSPLSPMDDKVYFTNSGKLFNYDFSDNKVTDLGIDFQANALNFAFVRLNKPDFPDFTLVGLAGNSGKRFMYHLTTGRYEVTTIDLPLQPTEIHDIGDAAGDIYAGGFVTGGIGVYHPAKDQTTSNVGIGQMEGMAELEGKIYFGTYPKARIYEYDPTQRWSMDDRNPKIVARLDDIEQNRPIAMLGLPEFQSVAIGTAPEYGQFGGALAIYHPKTGAIKKYRHVVANQSVIALAYHDGLVVGSTSVWGGSGLKPLEPYGKIFLWDITKDKKVFEIVPAKAALVSALAISADGHLWGIAGEELFVFEMKTRKVIYSAKKFPGAGGRLNSAALRFGKDLKLYGTVDGKFFRIDPATKAVTILRDKGDAERLAMDGQGNFYFKHKAHLWKYHTP